MNEIILKGEKSQSVADTSTAAETNPPVINITNNNTHHVSNVSNNSRNLTQVSNVNSTSNILNQVANINHTSNALTQFSSVSDNNDNRIFNQVSNANNSITSTKALNQINNSGLTNHLSKVNESNSSHQIAADQNFSESLHTFRPALLPAIDIDAARTHTSPTAAGASICRDLAVVPAAENNLHVGSLNSHLTIYGPVRATDARSNELATIPRATLAPVLPRAQGPCRFKPYTANLDIYQTRKHIFKSMKSAAEKKNRSAIILHKRKSATLSLLNRSGRKS